MPRITINEQEDLRLATFDVTENTVLIPMLFVRSWETTTNSEGVTSVKYTSTVPGPRLFTNARDFRDEFCSLGGGLNGAYPVYVTMSDNGFIPDKSVIMAYELLLQGLNVVIKPIALTNEANFAELDAEGRSGRVIMSTDNYRDLLAKAITAGAYDEFEDKNLYNIKFFTTGAYHNAGKDTSVYTTLVDLAQSRADAIALVEFKESFKDTNELFSVIGVDENGSSGIKASKNSKFAAAFFPWCKFNTSFKGESKSYTMPACFAYLMAYANSVQSNANWFAASGVMRGYIPNMLMPTFEVSESLMHALQGDSIYKNQRMLGIRVNPIMNAGTYGYRIWGNRVMWPGESGDNKVAGMMYQEFLNVRVLLCDIKKQVYHAAMRTTFEPNDDIVWINFKSLANTLLDRMKSGRGIKWYKWVKEKNEEKATIEATLYIQPIEAVEYFIVNIYLTDDDISVVEAVSDEFVSAEV